MIIKKFAQLIFFFLSLFFVYLGYSYHDPFYYFLALSLFALTISLFLSHKLPDKRIGFMNPLLRLKGFKISKILHKKHHDEKIKESKKWSISKVELIAVILFSLLFTFITIFKLPSNSQITNLISGYYLTHLRWFQQNSFYLAFLLSLVLVFSFINLRKEKRQKIKFVRSIIRIVLSVVLGFNLALLFTFIIAISEANLIAIRAKLQPKSTSIVWGQASVMSRIKSMEKPPKISGSDNGLKKTILSLNAKKIGFGQFNQQQIIPKLPEFSLVFLRFPNEALVMYDDYLFISEIKKGEIEAISPTIGKLYVKQKFEPRYIKNEPSVSVLGRQEYLKYRDDQINKKIAELDGYISKIQASVNNAYGSISYDKNRIAAFEAAISSGISERDSSYNNCINATCYTYSYSYYLGVYTIPYKCYSQDYCNSLRSSYDKAISENQTGLQQWKNQLAGDQKFLSDLLEYKKYFDSLKTLVATQKDQIPYELGVFESDDKVKVVLENTSDKAVADYFATLVHEYLHYTSYVSDDRTLPTFFEEGLTEYFARTIIKDELRTSTNLGYPHLVRVIQEMTKKIPEKELEQIYFTKDEKALIALLNETYGSNFYKDSEYYFWAMSFVSLKDALKFTNNIMFRIGGSELTEQDILSTNSSGN